MQYWLDRLYPDRRVRIYNFPLPGMDTAEVLRQLERRLGDQPDVVIVISGHNEFLRPASRTLDAHLVWQAVQSVIRFSSESSPE